MLALPSYSLQGDVVRLEKVDAVLNAKSANHWLQLNKEAKDYFRVYLPFLRETQDMSAVLESVRLGGSVQFGKLDMLNAYSQIPLPEELKQFTRFKVGGVVYQYRRLPFGLSISTHVFTMYMGIHMEIAKGRFLSTLLPECVRLAQPYGEPVE